jgi:hypothetical protein
VKAGIQAILNNIPLSDFDGVNDPVDVDMVCPHTMGEAIEERVKYYIEVAEDIARDLAYAYIADIDWHGVAVEQLAKWAEGAKK